MFFFFKAKKAQGLFGWGGGVGNVLKKTVFFFFFWGGGGGELTGKG